MIGVDHVFSDMLKDNPDVLASWIGREPNAFDGRDGDFVGTQGHDKTGRYVPYFERGEDGKITHTALTDYATAGPGDFYQLPITQQKTVVIEPYVYAIGGKEVLITSVAMPIIIDGKPRVSPVSTSRCNRRARHFRRSARWKRAI